MINSANRGSKQIVFGKDSIVIKKHISDIEGGRTLFMTGWILKNVPAGHVILKYTADGCYGPAPIEADGTDADGNVKYKYSAQPAGTVYAGILYRTISASDPQASIMFDGVVNPAAMLVPIDPIKTAFATAVPHIVFMEDEDCGTTVNA